MVLDGSVGTATVTTQGPPGRLRHDAKGGDFYLATDGDHFLATSGDFLMATDIRAGCNPREEAPGHAKMTRGTSRQAPVRGREWSDSATPRLGPPSLGRRSATTRR